MKQMKKIRHNFISVLFTAVFMLVAVFGSAMMVRCESLDPNQMGSISITLTANSGKDVMVGAEVSVYQVATAKENDHNLYYNKCAEFSECSIDLTQINEKSICKDMEDFIKSSSISGTTGKTDTQGMVRFDHLSPGLYFVMQTNTVAHFSNFDSFFITVPQKDGESYNYEVDATPKVEVEAFTDVTVKKIWNDGKNSDNKRPVKITVALKRGDETYGQVTLSKDNDWTYTWKDLPKGSTWSVKEIDVPKGYKATYKMDGATFIIENTPKLVQTGQLKWPIPILACVGVLFVIIGLNLREKKSKE